MTERERFEGWAAEELDNIKRNVAPAYVDECVEVGWNAWQARQPEIDALKVALEIICDTASTEWQEADGSRKGATDNRGELLFFVSKELIEDARAVLAKVQP